MKLYLTPAEVNEMPIGIGLQASLAQLESGVLEKMLARASQRCDTFCRRRLQAPGSTTLSTNAIIGATLIALNSTLTLDELSEQAAIIGTGTTQETVLIAPGGVTVSSFTTPYPGIAALLTPLAYAHSSGESVQLVYQEVTVLAEAGNPSHDSYVEVVETKGIQTSLVSVPPLGNSLTRTVFLKSFPIISLIGIEYSYYSTVWNTVDFSNGVSTAAFEGFYEFRVGQIMLREGLIRTTYTAGYEAIPDDIKTACSYYLAEQLEQMINPWGLIQSTMGKRTLKWDYQQPRSRLAMQAEDVLQNYRRAVL